MPCLLEPCILHVPLSGYQEVCHLRIRVNCELSLASWSVGVEGGTRKVIPTRQNSANTALYAQKGTDKYHFLLVSIWATALSGRAALL